MNVKCNLLGLTALAMFNVCPVFGFILNDTFDDGNRTIQNPPTSFAYFTSQQTSTLEEANGVLTLHGNSNRFLLAAVGDVGEYIELNDGEALTLEVTFRVEGKHVNDSRQLRLAWFNSGEKPGDQHAVYGDAFGSISPGTRNFRGYQTAISLWTPESREHVKPIKLLKRLRAHDDLLIMIHGKDSPYNQFVDGGVGEVADGDLNILQFYVRRVGDSIEVGTIIVPGGVAAGDETDFFHKVLDRRNAIFRYDYFAIGLNADDGSVERLDIESLRIFKVRS